MQSTAANSNLSRDVHPIPCCCGTGCNITLPRNATSGNCSTTAGLNYNSSCTFACQSGYEAPAGTGLTFECGDSGSLSLSANATCIRSMWGNDFPSRVRACISLLSHALLPGLDAADTAVNPDASKQTGTHTCPCIRAEHTRKQHTSSTHLALPLRSTENKHTNERAHTPASVFYARRLHDAGGPPHCTQ